MARHLSILLLVVLAITVAPTSNAKSRGKPRKSDGTYTLNVAGFVAGQGSAQVTPNVDVKLTLNVTAVRGGAAGQVSVTLPLNGAGRFQGDGTILGQPAFFEGRLDVPDDDKERAIRGVRLVCRLRSGTQYASIVGFIPELADARDSIDNGEDDNSDDRSRKNRSRSRSR